MLTHVEGERERERVREEREHAATTCSYPQPGWAAIIHPVRLLQEMHKIKTG